MSLSPPPKSPRKTRRAPKRTTTGAPGAPAPAPAPSPPPPGPSPVTSLTTRRLPASHFLLASSIPIKHYDDLWRQIPRMYDPALVAAGISWDTSSPGSSGLIAWYPWIDLSTDTYNALLAYEDVVLLTVVLRKFASVPNGTCTRGAQLLEELSSPAVVEQFEKKGWRIVWDCKRRALEESTRRLLKYNPQGYQYEDVTAQHHVDQILRAREERVARGRT